MSNNFGTDLSEDQERAAGEALVKLLNLKPMKKTWGDGTKRYTLGCGYLDKTALGLYRVLRAAFNQIEATGELELED